MTALGTAKTPRALTSELPPITDMVRPRGNAFAFLVPQNRFRFLKKNCRSRGAIFYARSRDVRDGRMVDAQADGRGRRRDKDLVGWLVSLAVEVGRSNARPCLHAPGAYLRGTQSGAKSAIKAQAPPPRQFAGTPDWSVPQTVFERALKRGERSLAGSLWKSICARLAGSSSRK
jgi:hypothetical protein